MSSDVTIALIRAFVRLSWVAREEEQNSGLWRPFARRQARGCRRCAQTDGLASEPVVGRPAGDK